MADPAPTARPARRPVYEHGAETDRDPDHLERTVRPAEIHEWLGACAQHRDAHRPGRGVPRVPVFSEWERTQFLPSVAAQAEKHAAQGRAKLLTGRQLVVLKAMFDKLAAATAQALEKDHG